MRIEDLRPCSSKAARTLRAWALLAVALLGGAAEAQQPALIFHQGSFDESPSIDRTPWPPA
jgi:hypothetical protein